MTQATLQSGMQQRGAPTSRSGAYRRSRGAQFRFVVVAVILAASAAGMQVLAKVMQGYFTKMPIPLKKPFDEFDKYKLGPEFSRNADTDRIPPLSEDMEASLGTTEYATWILTDNARPESPLGRATVFVTYYTGKPDMVPHVPDECMLSGGWERVWGPRTVDIDVPGVGAPGDKVAVRVQTFEEQSSMMRTGKAPRQSTVGYLFHANGQFVTTREAVRISQMNLTDRYAYYAKIQVDLTHLQLNENDDRADEIAEIERVMKKLLPILVSEHLPDWAAANANEKK